MGEGQQNGQVIGFASQYFVNDSLTSFDDSPTVNDYRFGHRVELQTECGEPVPVSDYEVMDIFQHIRRARCVLNVRGTLSYVLDRYGIVGYTLYIRPTGEPRDDPFLHLHAATCCNPQIEQVLNKRGHQPPHPERLHGQCDSDGRWRGCQLL